jgi:hypothetical protein
MINNNGLKIRMLLFYIWAPYLLTHFIGCTAPATPVRRSAVVPAARIPPKVGRALKPGKVKITAGMNPASLIVNTLDQEFQEPVEGDAGLYIPETQIEGAIRIGVVKYFEIGGHGFYADYDWTESTFTGVLPIPEEMDPDIYGGGPDFQINLTPDHHYIDMSFSLDFTSASIPQAIFVCPDCTNDENITMSEALARYKFYSYERKRFTLWNFSTHFVGKTKYINPYFIFSFQNAMTNIGFDPRYGSENESTLDNNEQIGIWAIGGEVAVDIGRFNITLYHPFDQDYVDSSFGISTQIGVELP